MTGKTIVRASRLNLRLAENEYELIATIAGYHGLRPGTYARLVLLKAARRAAEAEQKYGEGAAR